MKVSAASLQAVINDALQRAPSASTTHLLIARGGVHMVGGEVLAVYSVTSTHNCESVLERWYTGPALERLTFNVTADGKWTAESGAPRYVGVDLARDPDKCWVGIMHPGSDMYFVEVPRATP